ncbi:MAG: hypothetical protein K9W44_09965 [Candidatus Lokiarchaeota archaeon]|nr:hypothetical protein [Candidatus Harpocratesius repetitus]
MRLLKDRFQKSISGSEIISVAFEPRQKFIASSAFEEPVQVFRYPYMKLFKKIIHREKLPEMNQENALIYMKQTGKIDESQLDKLEAIQNNEIKIKGRILTANKVLFTPNGQFLVIGYSNGDLLVYNTRSWKKVMEKEFNSKIIGMRFIKNGSEIIINLANWEILFLNPTTWDVKEHKQISTQNLGEILVNDQKSILNLISDRKRLLILNYKDEKEIFRLKAHNSGINMIRLSPDQKILASCGNDGKICLFNIKTGEMITHLIGHTDEVHAFAFSPKGDYLISSSEDYTLRLWDISTFKCVKVMKNIAAAYTMQVVGQFLVMGNVEGGIMVFKLF